MATTKDEKRRKRREVPEPSPAPGVPPKARVEDRHGLWVVNSSRMKQYGDCVIERTGQVIRRQHLRNDDVLLKHGYVRPIEEDEEAEQCASCGLVFLGDALSGSFKTHRAFARHDLAKTDLDASIQTPSGRPHRVGDLAADPDASDAGDWDLEPDGAPGARKLEEETPRGVTVSMGNR